MSSTKIQRIQVLVSHFVRQDEERKRTHGAWATRVSRLAGATLDRFIDRRNGAQDVFEAGKVVRDCDSRIVRGDVDHAVSTDCIEVRESNSTGPDRSHLARKECSWEHCQLNIMNLKEEDWLTGFGPKTRGTSNTSILGEVGSNGVVGKACFDRGIRALKGGGATPAVVVQAVDIEAVGVSVTREVICKGVWDVDR